MSFLDRILGRDAPEEPPAPEGDPVWIAGVEAVLEELRPAFRADGGDVRLTGVSAEGVVTVRLIGACGHCYASDLTLRGALEPRLRERFDWFRELRAV